MRAGCPGQLDATERRQVKTLATDKPPSTGRRSEDPSDDFISVFMEAAAMAQYDSLRLPRVDLFNRRLRLSLLERSGSLMPKKIWPYG